MEYLKGRCSGLKQQSIRLVSKNRRFSPQTAQPTRARIQIIQIIRNPSPPFHQHANMLRFRLPTFRFAANLLQRRRVFREQLLVVLLFETGATHLGIPLPERADQMGKRVGCGIGEGRSGIVGGLDRGRYGREFEEAAEEEDEEGAAHHEGDGEGVEGL
ncbi:hypothetical protein EV2_045469 [Malus domestica]